MKKLFLLIGFVIISFAMQSQSVKFSVYQPQSTYSPEPYDFSGFSQALEKQEERRNNAYEKRLELVELIAEKKMQISSDEETQKWFRENIALKLKEVDGLIGIGDYSGAANAVSRIKGEIYLNDELIRKIKENKQNY